MTWTGEHSAHDAQHTQDTPLRPFVLTGGRAPTPAMGLRVDTLLQATTAVVRLPVDAPPQMKALAQMLEGGNLVVAEAAAHLKVPVSTVLVWAADLITSRQLTAHTTTPDPDPAPYPAGARSHQHPGTTPAANPAAGSAAGSVAGPAGSAPTGSAFLGSSVTRPSFELLADVLDGLYRL
ncbi:DUF742 domain-containing protein [Actinomadura kijaniata]|uniref:DUF742 domain-containing protein n=1 Tax=Actinomadura kijaniata TaxID=46161 RepID=UPI000834FE4E|nr:DUF742 domain-containing protein [Actinomadura kijaniata]